MKKIFLLISIIIGYFQVTEVSASVIATDKNKQFTDADVISKDNLEKGIYYENKVKNTNDDYYVDCRNSYYLHDNNNNVIIIVGSAISYDSENGMNYPYIEFYKEDKLVWKKQVKSFGAGYFISAVIKEEEIVCVGVNADEYQSKCIMYKCDFYGQPLESSIIQTNGVTIPKQIYAVNNGYIVIGTTTATEGIFALHKNNNNIIFMARFDYSFMNTDVVLIGNEGSNYIYDVIKFNDKIYFYAYVTGNGFYSFRNSNDGYCIIIFDERFEMIDYYEIDYKSGLSSFVIYNENIYFCNKAYEKTNIDFYKVYLDYINYEFSYNTVYYLENNIKIFYSSYENKLAIFEIININDINYLYVTVYQDDEKIYQYIKEVGSSFKFINGNLADTVVFCSSKEQIEISEIIYIKLNKGYCLFNDVLVEGVAEGIEEIKYGLYDVYVKYEYKDLQLYVREEYLINPEINVRNNEIYDLNLEIQSNGKCKLNNKEIENNYKITEEGTYLIELYGPNVVSYYTFVVKKISDDFVENDETIINIKEQINRSNEEIDIIQYRNIGSEKKENDDSSGIIITIMLLLSGGFIGLLVPLSYKIKEVVNND